MFDYDRTIVALNNVKASRQQVVNAVQLSENALKFIIGMPMEEEISVPKDTFAPSVLVENTDSIDISERTELKVLNKQLELLNWKIEASKPYGKSARNLLYVRTRTQNALVEWYSTWCILV